MTARVSPLNLSVGATHCVALDPQPRMLQEGEAVPRPYGSSSGSKQ
jgi:hypothetical protein